MSRPVGQPCVVAWSALSALGAGRTVFVDGLLDGTAGHLPQRPDDGPPAVGYPVDAFDATRLVGTKGTRTLDRMTLMVIATTKMVLGEDAAPPPDDLASVGLVLGTSTGSLASITGFLRDTFEQDRPYFVDPAAFPNTVINGPAGRTAIWHGLRGLNSTVSGGHLTGLAALRYASRMIRRGYAETLLVGSVEELSAPMEWAAHRIRGGRPGDDRRSRLGEGCVVFLLDAADSAARRGCRPLAELVGFEFGVTAPADGPSAQAERLAGAITALLRGAGAEPSDLWLLSLAQGGDGPLAAVEAEALARALGTSARMRRVCAAEHVGDSFSALGGFQLAAVLAVAEREDGAGDRLSLVTSLGKDGGVACALVRA